MRINLLLFFTFTLVGCGKDVSISNSKLERHSTITNGETEKVNKQGFLLRGNSDKIRYNGKEYLVSRFSSQSAMAFIASIASGTELPVTFAGEIQGQEIVLATLK